MCNQDRKFPITVQEVEENLRHERLSRIFETLKNIENDYPLLIGGPNDWAARTGQNFFNGKSTNGKSDVKDSATL